MNVLTYDDAYFDNIRMDRSTLLDEYHTNMLIYLKQCFPDVTHSVLQDNLESIMSSAIDIPTVDYIDSPSRGNFKLKSDHLVRYLNHTRQDIRSPSGATFVQPDVRESIFIPYIITNQKARKLVKKEEVLAEARGDDAMARHHHREQLNIKIGVNAISGVMLANVAYRSSIHYNSVTGTARFSTMTGYAFVERCLASNFYFSNVDEAINWIVNLLSSTPSEAKILSLVNKFNMKVPSKDEVLKIYGDAVDSYSKFVDKGPMEELIGSLSKMQLTYIFYANSFSRIMFENPSMRTIIDDMIDHSDIPEYTGDITTTRELSDDGITTFAFTLLSDEMKMDNGKVIPLDKIDTEHPELAKRIISLYHVIEIKLAKLTGLVNTFLNLPVLPSNTLNHKNMMRKTTVLSDTDSIIFTLTKWTHWYTGKMEATAKSRDMGAFVVLILTKCFLHMFTLLLVRMNVPSKYMRKLVMKNEFSFTSLLRTTIAKHYAALITMREGQVFDPPKLELKGRAFKSSTLCKETLTAIKALVMYVLNAPLKGYTLTFEDLLRRAIEFEQTIIQSTSLGETKYLETAPIRPKGEYKKPYSSSYLYAELWNCVFEGIHPALVLPQKCRVVPILPVKANTYKVRMPEELHKGWEAFFKKHPKKKISRVFIPMELPIPDALINVLDQEKILHFNCQALYLLMKSFNILTTSSFSNNYPDLAQQIGETLKDPSHDN